MVAHNSQEESQSHPYMHNNSYNDAEYDSRRGEIAEFACGNEGNVQYQDHFALPQTVWSISGTPKDILNSQEESQGHSCTHTNHHSDRLSATPGKQDSAHNQSQERSEINKQVSFKAHEVQTMSCVLVDDAEYDSDLDSDDCSTDTDSDDEDGGMQLPARRRRFLSHSLEEHAKAVHEVQLQQLEDDDDTPDLISSDDNDSDADDGPSEDAVTRRKQAHTPFQPSTACIKCSPHVRQTFELYEEGQDEDLLGECVPEHSCTRTCAFHSDQALPIESESESKNVLDVSSNGQPNCDNSDRVVSLTATTKPRLQALVAAHVDPTTVRLVLDSGCTQHIFNGNRENLTNFASKAQRNSVQRMTPPSLGSCQDPTQERGDFAVIQVVRQLKGIIIVPLNTPMHTL